MGGAKAGGGVRTAPLTQLDRFILTLRDWKKLPGTDPQYKDDPLHLSTNVQLPDVGLGNNRYFLARAANFGTLAVSLKTGKWAMHPSLIEGLNSCFGRTTRVFLFFAVDEPVSFAGVSVCLIRGLNLIVRLTLLIHG